MTHTLDSISYVIVFATICKILPPLAALLSILWMAFQFYHSGPVTEWRLKRKEAKHVARSSSSTDQ